MTRTFRFTTQDFINSVNSSTSKAGTLKMLGLVPNGANYLMFKKRVRALNLDTSHFLGAGHLKNKKHNWSPKIPLEQVLVQESTYSTGTLKKRLIKEGHLLYSCYECNIDSWRGKPLSLQIDHINGINDDHRLENLRLLCPNCHSQTSTFAGKNISATHRKPEVVNLPKVTRQPKIKTCPSCSYIINRKSKSCLKCHAKSNEKIIWPEREEIHRLVWEIGKSQLAKTLGVSDNAVAKRCKHLNIEMPPRGYWACIQAGMTKEESLKRCSHQSNPLAFG